MRLPRMIGALCYALTLMFVPADGAAAAQQLAHIPDFSGLWARTTLGFELPKSGQGPLPSKGTEGAYNAVGDYTNPLLTPQAAEVVRKKGEIFLSGVAFPTPSNQCYPYPPPYLFALNQAFEILQLKDEVIIIHMTDNQTRRVRLNGSHPKPVTPSWYGDSVGRYEDDALVIDTVGVRVTPVAIVDRYGTPYSDALHIVERYRLISGETAKNQISETNRLYRHPAPELDNGVFIDPNDRGNGLQMEFTVEDPKIFTKPWSALLTYQRAAGGWVERICAENTHTYFSKDTPVPTATKADF
jgi:hypothetical protein